MSKLQRTISFIAGLFFLACGIIMLASPNSGYYIVALILSISLLYFGVRMLIYYLTMARYMVGGKLILFLSLIVLDFGLFTVTLSDVPPMYIVLYLLAVHAFGGLVDILRGREARRYDSPEWKKHMIFGIVNIAIAFVALGYGIFSNSPDVVVVIYGLGLIYSAFGRIVAAFSRTEIVYIG